MKSLNPNNEDTRAMRRLTWLTLCFFSAGLFTPGAAQAADADLTREIPIEMDSSNVDTISMSFDGALLKDVLLLFSQQSGLNFVASQEVESKKVTVYFENVSPKDALSSIVSANGLAFSKKPGSDIYIVYPISKVQTAELSTKVIRLKYMRLSSSPLDVGGNVTVSDLAKSASASAGSSSSSSSSGSSSPPASTSGAGDKGADKLVQKLLSPQGKLATDLHTNSLIITDTADSIAAIEKILAQVDVPPSQVILEVHIMEVSKSMVSDMGIEWGGDSGTLGSFASGVRTTAFPFTENFLNKTKGVKPSLFVTELGDTDTAASNLEYGSIDATNLSAVLHYIETNGRTKILARPRVLTQNNEAASIQLSSNAAIGSKTTTAGTTTAPTVTAEAERAQIGVSMRMTPQINDDGTVLLFLEPSVTTAAQSAFFSDFVDTTTRLVRTMARVKDNETLVIAGLIDGQGTTARRKIPFLGDLPGIGKAFRYDSAEDVDRELIIFVTPHIVRGVTSLGVNSATARGEDVSVRRMLDQFMDKEMDSVGGTYENFEKTKQNFFSREEELVQDSERRYSNPVVERQMTQALDALSPQMIASKMASAMDALSSKK